MTEDGMEAERDAARFKGDDSGGTGSCKVKKEADRRRRVPRYKRNREKEEALNGTVRSSTFTFTFLLSSSPNHAIFRVVRVFKARESFITLEQRKNYRD